MNLVKAQMIAVYGEADNIEFMFNPTQLSFEGAIDTADNPGARSERTGHPKVSFSGIQPYKLTLNNLIFDTYESGQDVVDIYIEKFRRAIKFVDGGKQRPPLYKFCWGDKYPPYISCCFVERLTYKLTLFLPNGTPVRAVIDGLTLRETDPEDIDININIMSSSQTDPGSTSSMPPKILGRPFY